MSKDYYKILNIERDASDKDIKKAYKKLAIKYHPDKWANKSKEEQKSAEDKFKDINEAYSCLSDPQKKRNYDLYGTTEDMGSAGFDFNFDDLFSGMFGGMNSHAHRKPRFVKGSDLRIAINISIEDIFNGIDKKFRYKKYVKCNECHGKGGEGVKECLYCHGTGTITSMQQMGNSIFQSTQTCPHCHGTGKTVEHKCNKCDGSGLEYVTDEIKIKYPGIPQDGYFLTFKGKGNEAAEDNSIAGDLYVKFKYAFDENKYRIINNEIYELLDINYYDLILGNTIKHKLPNGKEIDIKIPECSQNGDILKLYGQGPRGGNYIIVFNIILPKSISDKEKELLNKIANK